MNPDNKWLKLLYQFFKWTIIMLAKAIAFVLFLIFIALEYLSKAINHLLYKLLFNRPIDQNYGK
jgi:hypothetical protein